MKLVFLSLFSLAFTITANGQVKPSLPVTSQVKPALKTLRHVCKEQQGEPYVLVNNFPTALNHTIIHPDDIKDLKTDNNAAVKETYGDKAKEGVVIITTKPTVRLLYLADILNKYNISPADQKLRVCIDNTLVSDPALIVATENMIAGVEITTERNGIEADDANNNERFINIQTNRQKK